MIRANATELAGGLLIIGIAALFAFGSLSYPMGDAGRPGPGIFPLVVAIITGLLGLGIAAKGLLGQGEKPLIITHRSVVAVIASVGAFALLIKPTGMVPTLFVVVLIGAAGSRQSKPLSSLGVAATTAIGCWLVFIVGLGLPIPAVRIPF